MERVLKRGVWNKSGQKKRKGESRQRIPRTFLEGQGQRTSAKLHAYAISILLPFICALLFSILLLFLLSRPLHNLPFITRSPLPAYYSGTPGEEGGEGRIAIACCTEEERGTVATHVQKRERRREASHSGPKMYNCTYV